jgi:hypothetical protein
MMCIRFEEFFFFNWNKATDRISFLKKTLSLPSRTSFCYNGSLVYSDGRARLAVW